MGTRMAAGVVMVSVGLMTVAALPASAALGKSVSSSALKTLESELNKGRHLTYEAVYKSVNGGQTTTVTIAQSPPKSYFSSSSGAVINNGKGTYFCSSTGGKSRCVNSGTAINSFTGLQSLFSGGAAAAALAEAKAGLLTRVLGIKSVTSSSTFAGQASTCLSVNVRGKNGGKFCFTKQGVLAYSGSSTTSYFQLTKFISSPPSSLFQLPAGATTVTLPGGGTIP